MPMPAMTITEAAAEHLRALMSGKEGEIAGVRIGVKSAGCSGLSYTMDFAEEITPGEEVVEAHGVRLLIDPKALMFVLGTEMDYKADELQSGFVFNNPNEKGRCGCGESFHV